MNSYSFLKNNLSSERQFYVLLCSFYVSDLLLTNMLQICSERLLEDLGRPLWLALVVAPPLVTVSICHEKDKPKLLHSLKGEPV